MKSRFSKYNDGMLYVCEVKKNEIGFGMVKNTREESDLKRILKLAYEEKTKEMKICSLRKTEEDHCL